VAAGERSLGNRALNPIMLEGEIEHLLTRMDEARTRGARERATKVATGSVLKGGLVDGTGGQRGVLDLKTLMPPMRGTRNFPRAMTTDRVTGTTGNSRASARRGKGNGRSLIQERNRGETADQ
jgi:hypothetical protein